MFCDLGYFEDLEEKAERRVQKKKCKLFPKGGEGFNPKLTFLKSLYTVKSGFKMDFFNTRMCFGKL